MDQVNSWHVKLLWSYLRLVLPGQLSSSHPTESDVLRRVLERPMNTEEYRALEAIVHVRARLARSHDTLTVNDHGAGRKGESVERTISSMHRTSSVPHWWGVFLFALVREWRPSIVLELGAHLGVSGAYIRSALDRTGPQGRFISIEGDPTLAAKARSTIGSVSPSAYDIVAGRFQDVLPEVLRRNTPIDMVFLDGHHEYQATLDYFRQIKPFLAERACIIFDDIYWWSRPVRTAWKRILREEDGALSIDLAKFGLLCLKRT